MPGLTPAELQDILTFTIGLAHRAGALILEGSHAIQRAGAGDVGAKKNAIDLVTEYDVRVEELVRSEIAQAYPDFQFIGEESYSAGKRPPLTDAPTFCVDPIDGTTNFVHGFPFACISLGLIDHKSPVLGVIYNPFLTQLYTAPRALAGLAEALVAVEWGSDRSREAIARKAASFSRLAQARPEGVMAHALRSVGSAALNFALVAQGALDMYWEIGCWPWDVCAGIVIAQESGGFVTGGHSAPHDGIVDAALLTGRRYLVIRGIADTSEETGRAAQARIAREFYNTVEEIPLDE